MPVIRIPNPFLALLIVLALTVAAPAMADALDDALRGGKVGETSRGYIAPVGAPSAGLTRLVNDINARRRAKYQSIARKNGISLQKIEAVAGSRIIQRAPAGTYFMDSGGQWRRK